MTLVARFGLGTLQQGEQSVTSEPSLGVGSEFNVNYSGPVTLSGNARLTLRRRPSPLNAIRRSQGGLQVILVLIAALSLMDAPVGHAADRTLRGHSGSTTGLAWNPDGTLLACGCFDKTIGIWNVETGKRRQTLPGHTHYVYCVAWNRDGTKVASSSYDRTVKVWDIKTGRDLWTNRGHTSAVMSVVWSPDGSRLACGSQDKMVQVLNAADGKTLHALKGHTDLVISVAWSPDGKTLASGGFDDVIRLWDPIAGKASGTLDGHTDAIEMVYWSPDGTRLASGARDLTATPVGDATGQKTAGAQRALTAD